MSDATVDNGCMWFVPGSHNHGLLPHRPVAEGNEESVYVDTDRIILGHHVRMTDHVDQSQAKPCPVRAGGCTIHTGNVSLLLNTLFGPHFKGLSF